MHLRNLLKCNRTICCINPPRGVIDESMTDSGTIVMLRHGVCVCVNPHPVDRGSNGTRHPSLARRRPQIVCGHFGELTDLWGATRVNHIVILYPSVCSWLNRKDIWRKDMGLASIMEKVELGK